MTDNESDSSIISGDGLGILLWLWMDKFKVAVVVDAGRDGTLRTNETNAPDPGLDPDGLEWVCECPFTFGDSPSEEIDLGFEDRLSLFKTG